MKIILLLIPFLFISEKDYSQVLSGGETARSPLYIGAALSANITTANKIGTGIRFSGGYPISDNFTLVFSTGYMTSYSNERTRIIQRMYDVNTNQINSTTQYESERKFQIVPASLYLKYSIPLLGVKTYALIGGGVDFMFNYGNYTVTTEKRNETTNQILESRSGSAESILGISNNTNNFGIGLGAGILIPVADNINLDISYLLLQNSFNPTIHSIGAGVNFGL